MAEIWRNWAGDQQCRPAAIEHPATKGAVADAVERAAHAGRTVRVSAAGHSFTDIACTDGVMLRLDGLNRVLEVDRDSGLVKVEAGIGLRALNEALDREGLAMENLGDIDSQSLAGAISTGTHGTGARFRNISAQIAALELVLANGGSVEVSDDSDADLFHAARVGLGSLGVITAVTLRTVPAFTIHRVDEPKPLDETLDNLDRLPDGSDHFEFYVFPHTDSALTRNSTRTDEQPRPKNPRKEYLEEVVIENWMVDAMARFGRRFPSTIPRLMGTVAKTLGGAVKIDRSFRVFASERRVKFTEMEYGIPREHGAEAVRRVLELIDRRGIDVSFPIEVRFVAADDAPLSPSHERDTCYIAVHMYQGMEWYPYFRGVEAIMNEYAGRPHWGKRHFQSAETLAPRYPRWEDFQRVRARVDPEGRFRNEYTDRVLGPIAAASKGRRKAKAAS